MNADKIQQYAAGPMQFFADLVIPGVHGPARFGTIMADFQRDWLRSLVPALIAISRGEKPPIGHYWLEGTKGTGKDFVCAICLLWLLPFARRPLDCQVGANDQDQANEVRKELRDILRLNPWLATRIEVQNWRILCDATGSVCEIIAADVAGSHGARPDVLILNELSHIGKEEFASNLMDNAAKVPQGLAIIATNAGFIGTWQFKWRELAMDSPRWLFHKYDRPAPWLDPAEIDEARRRNSRSRYLRLWEGVWASGTGDALDPDDIAACTNAKAGPMRGDEEGVGFVGGLDLGIKSDRASLCTLGIHAAGAFTKLAACEAWAPGLDGEVDLSAVETGVLQAAWQFPGLVVGFDPWQCLFMAQRLRRHGVNMVEVPFSGKNCDIMASAVLQAFRSRTIEIYNDAELIADLGRLRIVEKSYGFKLEAPRDKSGHADRATAFAIAASGIMPSIGNYVERVDDGMDEIFETLFGRDYFNQLNR